MLAMQYGFDLPADFDLDAVRQRVQEIGHRFDGLPGLHAKAFLLADRCGDAAKRYAPYYLWQDPAGMTEFLASAAFAAVEAKYGRPVVQVWSPIVFLTGEARDDAPTFASQQVIDVPAGTDLVALAAQERELAARVSTTSGLHTFFSGLDSTNWQVVRTAFWHSPPEFVAGARVYELLYLATAAQ